MKKYKFLAACGFMLTVAAAAAPQDSYGAGGTAPIAVIVSKSFPAEGVSFGDLKRVYMGSPVMVAGKLLVPITYPRETTERVDFDSTVLGMSAEEVGLYWIDRKIRGQSGPPKSVGNAATVVRVIAKVDGAIGFVKATAATGKDIKILRIDGKLPRESGYRL